MRRVLFLSGVCFALLATPASAQEVKLVAETEAIPPLEQLKKFHLPPGFRIELIAAEPECRKPMNLKFDAAGRLFFTQSIEYPWPVPEGNPGRDTIKVITDTNGDGVPDKVDTYAEGLNIPIGITPVLVGSPGIAIPGLLAYSIPTLNWFPDADGNGRADDRIERYRRFGYDDTHGMCSSLNWWIDGWVYGCHGFRNESEVKGSDGKPIKMQSGNTYRLQADGSHIESISHGQVNPFGMCFDPLGNQYTSDCHTRPAYMILRGAYYPSFGKPHDGLGFGPELMQHLHGSTGIAGVVYYADEQFPAEYRENLFIGNPVTGRINRDSLAVFGSTFKAIERPDFLSCDDPWFRPVDIQLAPDGSLYVADFYNCIIGHYEVPLNHPRRDRDKGRIWRISYVGEEKPGFSESLASALSEARLSEKPCFVPNLATASQADLIAALGHPNLPVRVMATHQLVHRIGTSCVAEVSRSLLSDRDTGSQWARAHAIWVLERLGGMSDDLISHVAADTDRIVRVHLVKAMGERGEWSSTIRDVVTRRLTDTDAFVRRAAVEAIGRHPEPGTERLLTQVWSNADPADEALIHTAKIAVRNSLVSRNSFAEIDPNAWTPAERERLLAACLGAPQSAAADLALRVLETAPWPEPLADELTQHAARNLVQDQLVRLAIVNEHYQKSNEGLQLRVMRAAHRGFQERGQPLPSDWMEWAEETANRLIADEREPRVRSGVELIRDLKLKRAAATLPDWLTPNAKYPGLRLVILDALLAVDHPQIVELAGQLLDRPDVPPDQQQHAIQLLGGLNREASREMLIQRLKSAPAPTALLLARGLALGPTSGGQFLEAIEKGQASPRLLLDATVEQRLRAARVTNLDERRNKLLEGLPPEDDRLKQLQAARRDGFSRSQPVAERGAPIFQKNCGNCHRLSNQGNKVGPELDGIGLRGLERLLEDTLDPNRNVDAAFRQTVVALKDGKVLTGLVLREEGAVLVLADEQGKEQRIPLNDIDERKQVKLSPMPANVAEKLSEPEFYDLVAFLLQQRTKPQSP